MEPTTICGMKSEEQQAARLVDWAIQGGISFMFDDSGNLTRLELIEDPWAKQTWSHLCVSLRSAPAFYQGRAAEAIASKR